MRAGDLPDCPGQDEGESLTSMFVTDNFQSHFSLYFFFPFPRHCWSEQPQIPLAESSCPLCQGGERMPSCNHCWGHHAAGEGIGMLGWALGTSLALSTSRHGKIRAWLHWDMLFSPPVVCVGKTSPTYTFISLMQSPCTRCHALVMQNAESAGAGLPLLTFCVLETTG